MGKSEINLISTPVSKRVITTKKATAKKAWPRSNTFLSVVILVNANYLLTTAATLPVGPSASFDAKRLETAGNIGCLFGPSLCDPELEWCYDDNVFGKCLPTTELVTESDMYRYDLSKVDMHILERQMERLFAMGYRWGHLYTQCVLQNLLQSIQRGEEMDETECMAVQDQDLEGALKVFQGDVNPWDLAFIKYSPSAKNPHPDFADENYKPPKEYQRLRNPDFVAGKAILTKGEPKTLRIQDKLKQPVIELPAAEVSESDPGLVEQELVNTVAQVKGKGRKGGKGKSGKGKGKGRTKAKMEVPEVMKKSILNVEYPGQSDNFNGVDIGSSKKTVVGSRDETALLREELLGSLIDNKLRMDADSGLDSNGVVNEEILRPKIFSSFYNTPDSFRLGEDGGGIGIEDGDQGSWDDGVDPGLESLGELYGVLPGYQSDARVVERRTGGMGQQRETPEDEELRNALLLLSLRAPLLLNKDDAEPEPWTDERGLLGGHFPTDLGPEPQQVSPFTQDLDYINKDDDLLYTDGGLVIPRPRQIVYPGLREEDPFEGDDERMLADDGRDNSAWGPVQLETADDEFLVPLNPGGNEYAEAYQVGSPFLFLNRRSRDGFSFERRERLDVKKPGPWYRTVNNYAFDKDDNGNKAHPYLKHGDPNPEFGAAEGPADMVEPSENDEEASDKGSLERILNWQNEQQVDKKSAPVNFDSVSASIALNDGHFEIIDTSYANIFLDKSVDWDTGRNIVEALAYALDLEPNTFKEITTNEDVVTFKVEPNVKGWNASEVAHRIQNMTRNLESEFGVKILKADVGIRASSKTPSVLALYDEQDPVSNQIYVATFAVCGLVAAGLVAAVAIFLIRKHSRSREKIVRLSQDDPNFEACKDYQDLCRARMAGAKNNEKMEPIRGPAHKIASKESENGTNSSRSSTSSWSEEPVLTNMDISTGHMVLSYMEDHLKNRDKLDKEWGSLCTYEADPCSTAVAEKAENSKKNRYSNSLPFDHSRVILNDLANVTGSDYINASTITDHDPRNPAYIATQGPLPNTAADFWQMVWEQGSVVIVDLTKLTENTNAMCHRYWPEEGSELHHIYEVHLVSEHIWCDEYLVRSFYLKNLKTGETRTVTQFHFLAWPENGIPQSTKALLEFRRKVNKSYRGRSCPIIVHCSDGAGRSGTYCLIDMVLNRMGKGAKEIDIAASLEHIRDQRPGMVRTKQQFEFVLMAVAEEVHAILKALPQ